MHADYAGSGARGETLLSWQHFSLAFKPRRDIHPAICDFSLQIRRGEIFALAGESGCGKSVLLRSVLRLLPDHARTEGSIFFEGRDLNQLPERELRALRGSAVGYVFQDPFNALNPVKSAGAQIAAQAARVLGLSADAARRRALELLDLLEFPRARERYSQLPHELSGGMRQRCAIALALAGRPRLLLADEITTALDVTVQAGLLQLLRRLNRELNLTVLLVSHDPSLPAQAADRIGIMYAGRLLEIGTMQEVFTNPLHPYTRALYQALPERAQRGRELFTLPGGVPAPACAGDPFAPRCRTALKIDFLKRPPLFAVSPSHAAASWALGAALHGGGLISGGASSLPPLQSQLQTQPHLLPPNAAEPPAAPAPQSAVVPSAAPAPVLLRAEHLTVTYPLARGSFKAVNDVSLELRQGEIIGLCGESGSGKSSLARVLALLQRPDGGRMFFQGEALPARYGLWERGQLRRCRRQVQLIFQGGAVNLKLSLFQIIAEPLIAHRLCRRGELKARVLSCMEQALLDRALLEEKAENLSGGQLQRAAIARALALQPEILIADEPTAALDLLTQAQIINLLQRLNREQGLTLLIISHDLHLLRFLTQRTAVMQQGRIVEQGETDELFSHASHPCTRALTAALPSADPTAACRRAAHSRS